MIVLEPQRRNSKEVPAHLLLGNEKVLSEADVSLLATWSCPGSVDTLASAFHGAWVGCPLITQGALSSRKNAAV
jgi:hypothetical protein